MTSSPTSRATQAGRYDALGLTKNPFGTLSPEEWVAVTVLPPQLETALQSSAHLLIMGRKGRGKSTVLRYAVAWHRQRGQAAAYEHLQLQQHHYVTDTAALDVFALDEMQRLSWHEAQRLYATMAGKRLIIGSHVDHRLAFMVRRWPLQVIRLGTIASRERLAKILMRRLDVFGLSPHGAQITFSDDAIDYLWGRFRGNLRHVDAFLYDLIQQRQSGGVLDAATLKAFAQTHPTRFYT